MSPIPSKSCHRCESRVRMTAEAHVASPDIFTTCDRCREVIAAEVAHINWNAQPREEIPHGRTEAPTTY